MFPIRGPVTDPSAFPCRSSSGKMVDPGINPSDRINSIRAIRRDLVADEEILGNRFIHPFFIPALFFNRPATIADLPDLIRRFPNLICRFPNLIRRLFQHLAEALIRRFIQHLTEAWSGDKDDQQENKKWHNSILRRLSEDCQPFDSRLRPIPQLHSG